MKKILLGVIAIGILVIYFQINKTEEETTNSDTEAVEETTHDTTTETAVPEKQFLLDELLEFDSEEALKEVYNENVTRSTGYYPEGMGEYQNTLLFAGTPNEVEFIWVDDSIGFKELAYLTISTSTTDWVTSDGITIGTNLKELEVLNKKPFSFYGFGWDYGGLTSFEDGYLSTRNISVTLELPEIDMEEYDDDLWGDHEMSSDLEMARKANPYVAKIMLSREE